MLPPFLGQDDSVFLVSVSAVRNGLSRLLRFRSLLRPLAQFATATIAQFLFLLRLLQTRHKSNTASISRLLTFPTLKRTTQMLPLKAASFLINLKDKNLSCGRRIALKRTLYSLLLEN